MAWLANRKASRANGVVPEQVDGALEPVGQFVAPFEELSRCRLVALHLGVAAGDALLLGEPAPVTGDHRTQTSDQFVAGQLGAAQAGHVELPCLA